MLCYNCTMTVIDDLLATTSAPQREVLERIRHLIHAAVPGAEEVMTYGMPGFKYRGRYLVAFAAFKDHMSVFPTSAPIEVFKDRLADFKTSKGTIQFTAQHPIPEALVTDIVKYQVSAINERFKRSKNNPV